MSAPLSSLRVLTRNTSRLTSIASRFAAQRSMPSATFSSSYSTLDARPESFTYRIAAASAPKRAPPRQPKPGRDFWNYPSNTLDPPSPYLNSAKKDSGEDAFFAARIGGNEHRVAFGVADGVGGWQDQGVDPSDYSQALCRLMAEYASTHTETNEGKALKPQSLLQRAYDAVMSNPRIEAGGCTASLAVMNGTGAIEAANLGDSGYLIFGPGRVVHRSEVQTHAFNTPYQLSKVPAKMQAQHAIFGGSAYFSETPADADITTHQLRHGDIVVFATDGVWDNLSAQDALGIISRIMEDGGFWFKSHNFPGAETMLNETMIQSLPHEIGDTAQETSLPGLLAAAIMREAKGAGLDRRREGPFAREVKQRYPQEGWEGGKPDDIAVLVAIAVDEHDDTPIKAKL